LTVHGRFDNHQDFIIILPFHKDLIKYHHK